MTRPRERASQPRARRRRSPSWWARDRSTPSTSPTARPPGRARARSALPRPPRSPSATCCSSREAATSRPSASSSPTALADVLASASPSRRRSPRSSVRGRDAVRKRHDLDPGRDRPPTQRRLWTVPLSDVSHTGVLAVGDLAIVGADDGSVTAVDAPTGKQAWSVDVGDHVLAPMAARGDLVLCACVRPESQGRAGSSRLALRTDPRSGATSRPAPPSTSARRASPGTPRGLLAASDATVRAVDLQTGPQRWAARASTRPTAGRAAAVDADAGVYVADQSGTSTPSTRPRVRSAGGSRPTDCAVGAADRRPPTPCFSRRATARHGARSPTPVIRSGTQRSPTAPSSGWPRPRTLVVAAHTGDALARRARDRCRRPDGGLAEPDHADPGGLVLLWLAAASRPSCSSSCSAARWTAACGMPDLARPTTTRSSIRGSPTWRGRDVSNKKKRKRPSGRRPTYRAPQPAPAPRRGLLDGLSRRARPAARRCRSCARRSRRGIDDRAVDPVARWSAIPVRPARRVGDPGPSSGSRGRSPRSASRSRSRPSPRSPTRRSRAGRSARRSAPPGVGAAAGPRRLGRLVAAVPRRDRRARGDGERSRSCERESVSVLGAPSCRSACFASPRSSGFISPRPADRRQPGRGLLRRARRDLRPGRLDGRRHLPLRVRAGDRCRRGAARDRHAAAKRPRGAYAGIGQPLAGGRLRACSRWSRCSHPLPGSPIGVTPTAGRLGGLHPRERLST